MLLILALTRDQWFAAIPFSLWGTIWGTLFFISAGAFADRFRVKVGDRVEVSASFLPDFLAAVILGPLVGAVVSGAAVVSWWQRGQLLRNIAHFSVFVLAGGTCGLVYIAVGSAFSARGSRDCRGGSSAVGGMVAGVAYQIVITRCLSPSHG